MKKFLGILGVLGLTATTASSVISCSDQINNNWPAPDVNSPISIAIVWYQDVMDAFKNQVDVKEQHGLHIYLNKEPKINIPYGKISFLEKETGTVFKLDLNEQNTSINSKGNDAGNLVKGYCISIYHLDKFNKFEKGKTYQVLIDGVEQCINPARNEFVYGKSSVKH